MSESIGCEVLLEGVVDGFEQLRDLAEGNRAMEAKADRWIQQLRGLNLPVSTKIKVSPIRVDLDRVDEVEVVIVD